MGRLNPDLLERIEQFSDRMLTLTDALARQRKPAWLLAQIGSAGSSVGANAFEADQAVSRPDFCRCLGIATKELNESRYWIRRCARQGWLRPKAVEPLEAEALELLRILGTMIVRSRRSAASRRARRDTSA